MTTSEGPDHPSEGERFGALLKAVRELVRCDAVALLRLEDGMLRAVAVDGLSDEALGRRFAVAAHPRFARLLESPAGVRFPPDCDLPDPYDGLVSGQPEILPVHDCMGAPLRLRGDTWGLLTLDALEPSAFDAVGPARMEALVRLVESGIEAAHAARDMARRTAQEQVLAEAWQSGRAAVRELVGTSAAMQQLRREIDTVGASDLTVLLLGETGVGKDLVAQRLHACSRRRSQPLVQVNCAALPETLADSELFGHRRGAFTGAIQDRTGKFELADGGTLFLDEVGELPLGVQAKLLRVLQGGELQRPGSDRTLRVDVRVIAATNRDLPAAIAQGRFRADLYHRLSVYPLVVPPLRARGRDVLALAGGFLEENQHRLGARNLRLSPAARTALLAHSWPGNVRELEHTISRAALRAYREHAPRARWVAIEPRHLLLEEAPLQPSPVDLPATAAAAETGTPVTLREATEAFQREWLAACVARHGGNLSRAAAQAGMDRSNFHRLLRKLGIAAQPPA
ncbi:nitric oxide reductase transcriptional regulator NorR [Variovorax sp. NFACC27]|uniref:nitric oxide reductase transcriptional regulator NorR n=1 Tax=unclassified Variovorax TaxID=663243 RepID=UPI000896186D|nr:nitric oxide reductase transcriptional regulator NorR [Variovorax sp. YR750]SEF20565.1 anaerobic nitric oxide reductase transcription regulator [Variovorax sp. NFACC28]SEF57063.1 anaerobic nitric oxide reductase transcription regulator [Variovorax sp. NFACC29]SFB70920.1 anaerobic nitric oxide reductase transcription regulator [Variovorax sp. NFACC26]SFG58131.1 anaerobic nitric oxide reductase transcription regulator [Variovorax sp. NFACC27]SEK89208.1 anaerobic nitric oxide reductase transcr